MVGKIQTLLLTVALTAPFALTQQMSHPMPGSPPKGGARATAALQKIKSLAGRGKAEQWEGKDQDGNPAQTSFEVVVAGTAVLETLRESGMEEMLTVYSVDGDGIALVHFCPTNNQPRMRAIPTGGDPGSGEVKELEFLFRGAGNLPTEATGHQRKLVLRFEDNDHIRETWTWRSKGKDSVTVIQFSRKGA